MDGRWEEPMRRALALAERGGGATSPNPMVGCVVVDGEGRILGEGWHARVGGPHAEVVALDAAEPGAARGATAVVTLEPCAAHGRTPPCTERLIAEEVARVVYAATDEDLGQGGAARLREAGIEVVAGVLGAGSRRLNEAWHHRVETGRTFVHAKVAHTLSGHVTRGTGRPRWISGAAARAAGHRLRRRLPAILVGIGTVRADDPALTVRDWPPPGGPPDDPAAGAHPWPDVQPLRVVLDSGLALPPGSTLARTADRTPTLVLCREDAAGEREAALAALGVEVRRLPAGPGGVDLEAALAELAGRGIDGVLVEPGPTLAAALLAAGRVDRWTAFVAPDADVAPDALALHAPAGPVGPFGLEDPEWTAFGRDAAVTGRPAPDRPTG